MTLIFDHTEPGWQARYAAHGRENGAATYSREIEQWQLPIWKELLWPDAVISTCAPLHLIKNAMLADRQTDGRDFVQYLHEPDHKLRTVHAVASAFPRTTFVTAYDDIHRRIRSAGLRSIYVPMTIDGSRLPELAGPPDPRKREIIYYGNLIGEKRRAYPELWREVDRAGWEMTVVTHNRVRKGPEIAPDEVLSYVGTFAYGIGVGRCALEMMAMGMKVLIYGRGLGGIVRTSQDAGTQTLTNFNGMVRTGPRFIRQCLRELPGSLSVDRDIRTCLPQVREAIVSGWRDLG